MTTPVIVLTPGDSIGRCREAMERGAIRDITVVDADNRVIGTVSNRDLLLAARRGLGFVADIMAPVPTVRPESTALEALERMINDQLSSIPVVGPSQELVGVVTEAAFLIVARSALTEATPRQRPARSARAD